MLKGIPALVSPELLKILCEMGHGDEIVIGDGNFPAASCAQRLLKMKLTRFLWLVVLQESLLFRKLLRTLWAKNLLRVLTLTNV